LKKFIWRKLFLSSNPSKPNFISIFPSKRRSFLDRSKFEFKFVWIVWLGLTGFKPPALCQGPRVRDLHLPCLGSRPSPSGIAVGYRRLPVGTEAPSSSRRVAPRSTRPPTLLSHRCTCHFKPMVTTTSPPPIRSLSLSHPCFPLQVKHAATPYTWVDLCLSKIGCMS
jgi:hypothetical protein